MPTHRINFVSVLNHHGTGTHEPDSGYTNLSCPEKRYRTGKYQCPFFLASLSEGDGPGAASKGRGECVVAQVTAESMQCTGRSLLSSPHDTL